MYALALGPMVWIAIGGVISGTLIQVIRFYSLSRKAECLSRRPIASTTENSRFPGQAFKDRLRTLRRHLIATVIAVDPLIVTVSVLFHLCLVGAPLFLLGHTELILQTLGIELPSIPEGLSDVLTVIVLICCTFFLLRRIFLARVRAITAFSDYAVLALATVPFLSGFMAYHQMLDYRMLMIVHMLSGELMLMAIPFTKLTHMIFFFLNRFMIVNEHTLGRGSRVW